MLTGVYGVLTGGLNFRGVLECVVDTATSTALIFFILLGAQLFNTFLAFTQAPQMLADWVGSQGFAPMSVLLVMLVCYLIFGCVMDSLSMILLTIPYFFRLSNRSILACPARTAIWLGILALIVVEVG